MNDVSSDNGQPEWWVINDLKDEPWVAVARIALGDKGARLSIQIRSDFLLERVEMGVCAPQFFDDTGERVAVHAEQPTSDGSLNVR